MMFPSDSWGKLGATWTSSRPVMVPVKPNRKKNRKLARQMRRIKGGTKQAEQVKSSKLTLCIPRFNLVIGNGDVRFCCNCANTWNPNEFPCKKCFEVGYSDTGTSYFMPKE